VSGVRLKGGPIWQLEEELAAAIGVAVQRGGDLIERSAAVLSPETPATYRYMRVTQDGSPGQPGRMAKRLPLLEYAPRTQTAV
jgi:hypothetical protein